MKTSKWCNENINSSQMQLVSLKLEIKELLEVKSFKEFKEELSDCIYSALCVLNTKTGISLPMIGVSATIRKANLRFKKWDEIFNMHDLQFNKKYLVNGSNYNKPEKVELALKMCIEEV